MTSCCLADILRIFAPNAPFSQLELQSIFSMFFEQLRGIGAPASPNFPSYLYLLESFSMVNTPLILVEFESDDMLVELFSLFFDLAKQDLAPRITSYILGIQQAILAELEHISNRLLLIILVHLVPSTKATNRGGYQMAQQLISRSDQVLERPIINFVRDHIVQDREIEDVENAQVYEILLEDRKARMEIIYELCVHNASLIISLHPDFQDLMEVEDPAERLSWVELFGRVFTTRESSMSRDFPQLILSYMKRFGDIDANIRCKIIEYALQLLVQCEAQQEAICEYLLQRSCDRDEKVRKAVCTTVCGAAVLSPDSVTLALLNAIGKRTMDKKFSVRKEAVEGMAKLFKTHCSEYWKAAKALPQSSKKFSWIPRKLLLTAVLDMPMKMLIMSAMDEIIMDTKYSVTERTRCLIGIFTSFEPRSKKVFLTHFMQNKKSVQDVVMKLLDLQEEIKKDPSDSNLKRKRILLVASLAKQFVSESGPEEDKLLKQLHEIFSSRDRNVQKCLKVLANPESSYSGLRTAQLELVRSVAASKQGSKKTQLQKRDTIAWRLGTLISMTLLSMDMVPILFQQIEELASEGRLVLAQGALELLLKLAQMYPGVLSENGVFTALAPFAEHDNESVAYLALKIMSLCKPRDELGEAESKLVGDFAKRLATDGMSKQAKYAVRAFSFVCNAQGEFLLSGSKKSKSTSMEQICAASFKQLKVNSDKLETAFAAIGEIGLFYPDLLDNRHDELLEFIKDKLMISIPDSQVEPDDLLDAKVAALKAVTKILLGLAGKAKETELDDSQSRETCRSTGLPFIRLLLQIIKSDGDLTGKRAGEEDPDVSRDEEECPGKDLGMLVLTAAKCLVKLCSCPVYERTLSRVPPKGVAPAAAQKTYDPFLNLALVAHNDTSFVRTKFIDYVFRRLTLSALPFHYISILVLCASHDRAEMEKMKSMLTRLVVRQRNIWKTTQKLQNPDDEGDSPTNNNGLPELALANIIYLLAHHPDFMDDPSEDQGMLCQVYDFFINFPKFFLDCLFTKGAQGSQDNNYLLVSNIIQHIKNCEDIRDPGNTKIYKVAELAYISLRNMYQGKDFSGSKHPGSITLPANLYVPRKSRPKPRYLPAWYQPEGVAEILSPEANAAARGTPSTHKKQLATTSPSSSEKKSKPSKRSTSKKLKEPTPGTRERLPRSAKDSGAKALNFDNDSESDEEFEKMLNESGDANKENKMMDTEDDGGVDSEDEIEEKKAPATRGGRRSGRAAPGKRNTTKKGKKRAAAALSEDDDDRKAALEDEEDEKDEEESVPSPQKTRKTQSSSVRSVLYPAFIVFGT